MLVGHFTSTLLNDTKGEQRKPNTFWKETLGRKRLNDEVSSLKGAKKVALDCTASKVAEIDYKVKSLEEKLHKI